LIPEIDIWRIATLMLNRYGDEAMMESAERAENLAVDGILVEPGCYFRIAGRNRRAEHRS
jgi:hypothetical protein